MSGSQGGSADEEAAAWLARLQSCSISTAELEAYARWRREPKNAEAYARAEAVWADSARLSNDPDIAQALRGDTGFHTRRLGDLVPRPTLLLLGAAAAVAVVFCTITFGTAGGAHAYQTATGERSTVRLADGSEVQLDTDSAVAARLSPDRRQISLTRGQAFFRVAHAPQRPFVVDAGDGVTVTATGTQFDVRRTPDRIIVALAEGSVIVRRGDTDLATLRPGALVEVALGNGLVPTTRTLAETTGWRAGHLSFRDTPLVEAVAEVNRYTDIKIAIRRSGADRETISGEFLTNDPEGFKRAVNALLGDGTVDR
jgi:transmembrane sensor